MKAEMRKRATREYINDIYSYAIMRTPETLKAKINMPIAEMLIKYDYNYLRAYNFIYSVTSKVNQIMSENPSMAEDCILFKRQMEIISNALEVVMEKDFGVTGLIVNDDHFEAIL